MSNPLINPANVSHSAEEQAQIDAVLKAVKELLGFVPAALQLYSVSPPVLHGFASVVGYFRTHETLPQGLLAMIRYLASDAAGCRYCVSMNETILTQTLGLDLERIRAARDDLELAPLPANEMPLLRLALKGVDNSDAVSADDLDAAKAEGWTDRDCFEVIAMAAQNRSLNLVLKSFDLEEEGDLL